MARSRIWRRCMAFANDDSGATAIEYALIAGGIMVAIVAIVYQLGTTLAGSYQDVADGFN